MKQTIKMLGNRLESSSATTPEFLVVYRMFKKEFTKILKDKGCIDIQISKGHFYVSGFFTSCTGQIWYFSCQDFRDPPKNVLYRTAKSYKDFTGGSNQYASLENLQQELRIEHLNQKMEVV